MMRQEDHPLPADALTTEVRKRQLQPETALPEVARSQEQGLPRLQ
ncbi:hypothetical protein [Arthrobacter woluwensis]|nr:hypothetical protein [Arthrobacter woluwensis]